MLHQKYMTLAIEEAKKAIGFTSPNPLVGAVIVKDNAVIGIGYHKCYGDLHAERNAILNATKDTKNSTLYVTLEPCNHHGKTPPCTDIIIESGIKTVVIGSFDPNPLVSGSGIKRLQEAGITVITNFMKDECDALNSVFFHFITTHTPYVVLKYAMSADGKISTSTGQSQWISNEKSRENVHNLRHAYSGIMVGVNTVISDNPQLTTRIPNGKNPIRIICDSHLRTPKDSYVVKTAKEIPTIIATSSTDDFLKESYSNLGCTVLDVPTKNNVISLEHLMVLLGEKNIDSVLLEGGSSLSFSALEAGIVNKVQAYIAPKILGGETAKTPVDGLGFANLKDATFLSKPSVTFFEDDILLEWQVKKDVHRNY